MIIAIDASVLLHLIDPHLAVPPGPDGRVPDRCAERLDHLIDEMSKRGDRMLIPTPSLSEALVKAGNAGQDWLNSLHGRKAVRVAPFDEKAAVECAELVRQRHGRRGRTTRAKAKFDEQIVAIAVAERAEVLLSDDPDIRNIAPPTLIVKGIGDLDLPPDDPQGGLFDERAS